MSVTGGGVGVGGRGRRAAGACDARVGGRRWASAWAKASGCPRSSADTSARSAGSSTGTSRRSCPAAGRTTRAFPVRAPTGSRTDTSLRPRRSIRGSSPVSASSRMRVSRRSTNASNSDSVISCRSSHAANRRGSARRNRFSSSLSHSCFASSNVEAVNAAPSIGEGRRRAFVQDEVGVRQLLVVRADERRSSETAGQSEEQDEEHDQQLPAAAGRAVAGHVDGLRHLWRDVSAAAREGDRSRRTPISPR